MAWSLSYSFQPVLIQPGVGQLSSAGLAPVLSVTSGSGVNAGDSVTVTGSGFGSTMPSFAIAGGFNSEVDQTAVGQTPNFGNNHQSAGGNAGATNYDRFSATGVVVNDGVRGKVFGASNVSESAQEINFPSTVPPGGSVFIRMWARYSDTWVSNNPDAQNKWFRIQCGTSDITDQTTGQFYLHCNHNNGTPSQNNLQQNLELNYPLTGQGHHTWFFGNNTSLPQIDGVWRVVELFIRAPSSQGASDGGVYVRTVGNGAVNPFVTGTSSYGDDLQTGFPGYPGTDRYSAFTPQNWSGNGMSGLTYAWEDLYVSVASGTTQVRVEVWNNVTPSLATIREIQVPTAWANGSVTFTFNKGALVSGNTYTAVVVSTNFNTGVETVLGSKSILVA